MDSKSRNARMVAGVLAFGLMVSALVFLFFGPTAVAQSRRIAQILKYQELLGPRLAADPRFQSIRLGISTTSGGGALFVHGSVATQADLQALKAVIASTPPPSAVSYRVALSKQ